MNEQTPRLVTPRAARISALVLIVCCIGLIAAEFVYEKHPSFGFDDFFGLYALVGFVTVIVFALFARLLRPMLGRHGNYYGEAEPDVDALDSRGDDHG